MDICIFPHLLSGQISAISAKAQAHRLLICAAFSQTDTQVLCTETNQDIEATAQCLQALGANIRRTETGYTVTPIKRLPSEAILPCRESGSTLRFLLPIAGALGVKTTFQMEGRLPQRPLSPLWEEMERMGCRLSRPTEDTVLCEGRLRAGDYIIDGGISSQFITGLLFALALIPGKSSLKITGKLESKSYVDMTCKALSLFSVSTDMSALSGRYPFSSPGAVTVEGDWSNAAFFLAARALGCPVVVTGLSGDSAQGDRAVLPMLKMLDNSCTLSMADTPDLLPVLAVVAGAKKGAVFTDIGRLRLKESDRVETVAAMLRGLGAQVEITQTSMTVHPAPYRSCTVDAAGDHRIAMAAAIAAVAADGPVTVLGAHCVAKSYPAFWADYEKLGGRYEQYLR